MIVEEIGPDEVDRYRAIRLQALTADPSSFCSTVEREQSLSAQDWLERVTGAVVFIAVDADRDVGTVTLKSADGTGELVGMWVSPGHRGSGVAAALVGACLDRAATLGAQQVELGVFQSNQRAIAFYRRQGFRIVESGDSQQAGLCRMVAEPKGM